MSFFSCVCIVVFYVFRHSHAAILSPRNYRNGHHFSTTTPGISYFGGQCQCLHIFIFFEEFCYHASIKYVLMCGFEWLHDVWGCNKNICWITYLPRTMYYDYNKHWMIISFCFRSKKFFSAWDVSLSCQQRHLFWSIAAATAAAASIEDSKEVNGCGKKQKLN